MLRGKGTLWWVFGAVIVLGLMLTGCSPELSPHFVSTPSRPSGPASGEVGQLLTFSTGGASSSKGHPVEYQFDWGDGTFSSWSASTTAEKAWKKAGTYQVRARARSAVEISVVSDWSPAWSVTITAPAYGGIGDTRDNGRLAITLLGVRTATKIGLFEPDPGRIFLIVNLKAKALRDDQYVSKFSMKIVQSDGRVQDTFSLATYSLDHPFEDAELDEGQWTGGEVAFEVAPGQTHYTFEYGGMWDDPIKFRFSL